MDRRALAERFESHRDHLRGVAYRMLGSLDEADDAVQQAWLRADRADIADVDNLPGWLTTVVARISLDQLRSRKARGEEPLADAVRERRGGTDPEQQAVLAEAVGLALLVVLDRLGPAERVAFVLHDMFGVPFGEIATVVGRSEVATKKLASRARERVRGAPQAGDSGELGQHRAIVEAFLAAVRVGDLDTIVGLLAPDVVRYADRFAVPAAIPAEVRGARAVAEETKLFARRAGMAEVAHVDGAPGVVVAPHGRMLLVLRVTVAGGRITEVDAVGDPSRLAELELTVS